MYCDRRTKEKRQRGGCRYRTNATGMEQDNASAETCTALQSGTNLPTNGVGTSAWKATRTENNSGQGRKRKDSGAAADTEPMRQGWSRTMRVSMQEEATYMVPDLFLSRRHVLLCNLVQTYLQTESGPRHGKTAGRLQIQNQCDRDGAGQCE
jgi:hypothetical protein